MMTPKMPTRFPIGQAVVNDEAKGCVNDGIGVSRLRRGDMRRVDREMRFTFATIMFGIVQNDFGGATGRRIAEVVELSLAKCVSSAGVLAVGASAFFADTGTFFERWFWQIIGIDNTFGGVGNVLTGSGHGGCLRKQSLNGGRIHILRQPVKDNLPTLFAQSPKKAHFHATTL